MKFLFGFLIALSSLQAEANVRIKMKVENGQKTLLSASPVHGKSFLGQLQGKKLLRQIPYFIAEGIDTGSAVYEEYEISDDQISEDIRGLLKRQQRFDNARAEFREIIVQGPKENRINLTILGDGYTLAEKEKFFADAKRTTEGLFVGKTFASYLPLFNVYAVFVASNESGIGDGSPKNTAFRLYRTPPGSKRAIMPGDEAALERALDSAPATDYPIVLANDNFYGGLGGRYAISTSSERSGLVVLRHELGHNFGEVGEEYDNGQVYIGANASRSAQVPWSQWVDGTTSINEAKIISGNYVWQNLSKAYSAKFTIPSGMSQLFLNISSVGWDTSKDVSIQVNGLELPYDGKFHEDRSFFDIAPTAVKPGDSYKLDIRQNINDGNNVLGFAVAFAAPANYDFTPNKIGAFASYDTNGGKTYRPTHNSCIMRNMEIEHFCVVDQENMWLKFLNRVSLIDSIEANSQKVTLADQKLEGLEVRWYQLVNGQEQELAQFSNVLTWDNPGLTGNFRVKVKFTTQEVRKSSPRLTQSKDFKI